MLWEARGLLQLAHLLCNASISCVCEHMAPISYPRAPMCTCKSNCACPVLKSIVWWVPWFGRVCTLWPQFCLLTILSPHVVFCHVYITEHSYVSVKATVSSTAQEILRVVAEKIQHAEEDLALVVVTFSGGKLYSVFEYLIVHWLASKGRALTFLWSKCAVRPFWVRSWVITLTMRSLLPEVFPWQQLGTIGYWISSPRTREAC